ncbi:hypothetical protein [Streptomyces xiamenensis]|uniref:hypothetical protein n=1 Tax=Streptomyces xiamenensis TaxID=408015 RepID=UPI003D72B45C
MFNVIRRRLFGTARATTNRSELVTTLDAWTTHPANLTTHLDTGLAFQPGLIAGHGEVFDSAAYLGTLARRATELGEDDLAYHLGNAEELALALQAAMREAALATVPAEVVR